MYYDANNLYGQAMVQSLPTGNYKEEEAKLFTVEHIMSIDANDGPKGFMLCVDVEYPKELHDLHNDYPLCPERVEGTFSPFMEEVRKKYKLKPAKVPKLIPNLRHKRNYLTDIRNLQQDIRFGLKLKAVHTVISYDQSKWLAPYINKNTELRAQSKSDFEKDLFKLMNNAVFGKTMENIRKRINITLATSNKELQKQINKHTFKRTTMIGEKLAIVHHHKKTIKMNKPIAVGFTILELSKLHMYDFHYNYIKKLYGTKATLLFTDTDSLCYLIETEDIYQDMLKRQELFDFSDYPEDHPCYSKANKKVIGKFKDEANGQQIQEFVGLRSKMYSILYDVPQIDKDTKELYSSKRVGKGIKKHYIKDSLTHEDYLKALYAEGDLMKASFNAIRSHKHQIYSEHVTKTSLCCLDDKRYVLDDGITTLAHGHYSL